MTGFQSVKEIDAKDKQYEIIEFKEGKFASVEVKENIYKWKPMTEKNLDKINNAVNQFKFWNAYKLKNNLIEFEIELNSINHFISLFNKMIKKLCKEKNLPLIELYYEKNQGKWYDGEHHFVDYLWDDVIYSVKEKHGDWLNINFLMTDDVYVLQCMLNKKLYFQHNIKGKNSISLVNHALEITKEIFNNSSRIDKVKSVNKFNQKKSIIIEFE